MNFVGGGHSTEGPIAHLPRPALQALNSPQTKALISVDLGRRELDGHAKNFSLFGHETPVPPCSRIARLIVPDLRAQGPYDHQGQNLPERQTVRHVAAHGE